MATLNIDDKTAREIYPKSPDALKTILEETFGGKKFFEQKITDRVKTFEDAINVTGRSVAVAGTADTIAYIQLKEIAVALNEGWIPNWNNSSEYKWYPWFYMDSDRGFGLNYVYCDSSDSLVGSRLCFKTEALAKYAATQFKDLYQQFFTI